MHPLPRGWACIAICKSGFQRRGNAQAGLHCERGEGNILEFRHCRRLSRCVPALARGKRVAAQELRKTASRGSGAHCEGRVRSARIAGHERRGRAGVLSKARLCTADALDGKASLKKRRVIFFRVWCEWLTPRKLSSF